MEIEKAVSGGGIKSPFESGIAVDTSRRITGGADGYVNFTTCYGAVLITNLSDVNQLNFHGSVGCRMFDFDNARSVYIGNEVGVRTMTSKIWIKTHEL